MKDFLDAWPMIYLITDGTANLQNFPRKSNEFLKLTKAAVDTGISLIQIREKNLPARFVFQLVAEAVKITKHSKTKLLVNDRADIAGAAGADGVHLTSTSIPTEIIRQNFPKDFIIGVSTHTLAKANIAQTQGADFVTFGPVFNSPNKGAPKGTFVLREVCENLRPFSVIALGGIDETNLAEVLNAGAKGIAGIRLLNNIKKLPEIAAQIQSFKRENE